MSAGRSGVGLTKWPESLCAYWKATAYGPGCPRQRKDPEASTDNARRAGGGTKNFTSSAVSMAPRGATERTAMSGPRNLAQLTAGGGIGAHGERIAEVCFMPSASVPWTMTFVLVVREDIASLRRRTCVGRGDIRILPMRDAADAAKFGARTQQSMVAACDSGW